MTHGVFQKSIFLALCALLSGVVDNAAAVSASDTQEASRNLVVQAVQQSAGNEQRLALVIGNSAYKEGPLANPVNDARSMAQALESAGFKVTLLTDAEHRVMLGAVRDFGTRLRQGGVGVFYYAGHGMQIKGRNYLIPIGADIQREDEVAYGALDAQAVLDKMEAAANSTNLMILDACRNNPFVRSFRSSTQGLAQMEAPVGTLVAFATAPGGVASDGAGSNGLYTQHLLTAMKAPGAQIEDVFKQVRAGVRRESQGKQVPWEVTSLEGELYFYPPQTVAAAAMPAPATIPTASATVTGTATRPFSAGTPPSVQASTVLQVSAGETPPAAVLPSQPAALAAATTPTRPIKAPPPQNLHGFTTGDTWNYQVIDRYRQEVVRNYTSRVGRILPTGGFLSPSGDSEYDSLGRVVRWTSKPGETTMLTPHGARWWDDMKVGEKRNLVYRSAVATSSEKFLNEFDVDGKVAALETVKVPAGEFQAYRIEYSGSNTAIGRPGAGRFNLTLWYAPELHTLIALERAGVWNGRPDTREREELTSFTLINPPPGR